MSKNKKVPKSTCSNCHKDFDAQAKKETFDTGERGHVEISFLECTHCGTRYIAFLEDGQIKRGIKRAAELAKVCRAEKNQVKRSRLWRKYERQVKKNRRLMWDKLSPDGGYQDLIEKVKDGGKK